MHMTTPESIFNLNIQMRTFTDSTNRLWGCITLTTHKTVISSVILANGLIICYNPSLSITGIDRNVVLTKSKCVCILSVPYYQYLDLFLIPSPIIGTPNIWTCHIVYLGTLVGSNRQRYDRNDFLSQVKISKIPPKSPFLSDSTITTHPIDPIFFELIGLAIIQPQEVYGENPIIESVVIKTNSGSPWRSRDTGLEMLDPRLYNRVE